MHEKDFITRDKTREAMPISDFSTWKFVIFRLINLKDVYQARLMESSWIWDIFSLTVFRIKPTFCQKITQPMGISHPLLNWQSMKSIFKTFCITLNWTRYSLFLKHNSNKKLKSGLGNRIIAHLSINHMTALHQSRPNLD